jgi:hypothetical protein
LPPSAPPSSAPPSSAPPSSAPPPLVLNHSHKDYCRQHNQNMPACRLNPNCNWIPKKRSCQKRPGVGHPDPRMRRTYPPSP